MRRTFITVTAASAALVLAACNGDTTDDNGTEDAQTPTAQTTEDTTDTAPEDSTTTEDAADGTEAAGGLTDPVCVEFFETQGTPLDERVTEQLEVVGAGDDLDPVSYSQVSLLNSRIADLTEDASGEQAALLERINAPFGEVVDAVVSEGTRQEEQIVIPEVDTADAEAALEEFEASCA